MEPPTNLPPPPPSLPSWLLEQAGDAGIKHTEEISSPPQQEFLKFYLLKLPALQL
ncbi:hypothetical protein SBV47_04815 [Chlamydia crocodili]|uniref:hypothetical protein n=1 Tax=Chlamydia TaxID=810 RepID=UPI002FCAEA58